MSTTETQMAESISGAPEVQVQSGARRGRKFDHSFKYMHDHVEKVRHSDGTEWYYFVPLERDPTYFSAGASSPPIITEPFKEDHDGVTEFERDSDVKYDGDATEAGITPLMTSAASPDDPPVARGFAATRTASDILPATLIQKQRVNRRIVFWEGKIKRISDINTQTETFRCRMHYYLTWLATRTEKQHWDKFVENQQMQLEEIGFFESSETWTPEWVPNIELANAVTIYSHELSHAGYELKSSQNSAGMRSSWEKSDSEIKELLGFNPLKAHWIRARFECDCEFAEEMELSAFPFDAQDFTIFYKCSETADQCTILPFPRGSKFCALDSQFSVLHEWELEKLMVEFRNTSGSGSRSGRTYSLVSVHVKASRKWGVQIGNVFLTFALFTLGLATFSNDADPTGLGERLGFAVTLMLADVATLQYWAGELPKSPVMTWMDWYMYTCFTFLFACTAWTGFVGINGGMKKVDYWARWVFLGVFLFLNCHFAWDAYNRRTEERKTLDKTDEELEEFNRRKNRRGKRRGFSIPYSNNMVGTQTRKHVMVWKSQEYTTSHRGENIIGQITSAQRQAVRWFSDTG
jgi:hypothetical protein